MTTRRALMVAIVCLAVPAGVYAQTVGTLVGHVYDQSGVPLKGVTVTALSDTQIGGSKTTATQDDGSFRFNSLSPGKFTVVASAPKLRKTEQQGIRITQGATVEIDIIMEVETGDVEEVKVVEKAPLINTNKPTVGASFDQEFINELPLSSRDYQGVMALTAGVTDIAGTGNPNVRGGTYFGNSYTVDGFQTTDPVTHTFGQNFSFDAMAKVDVQTAAFGAENAGVTGGITNIVTKSGSNRLEVSGTAMYTDQHLRFFKDARDIGTNRGMRAGVNVGGPVIKDRVWFYVSGEAINSVFTLPRDTSFPDHPPYSLLAFNGIAKLTWQVTPRNKIELKGTFSPGDFRNVIQSYLVEPEAEARQYQRTSFAGLSWHSVLTDELILESRAGFQEMFFNVGPQSCLWNPNCTELASEQDVRTGAVRKNYGGQVRDFRRTFELSGSLSWYKNTRKFGSHTVRLGGRYLGLNNLSANTVPGDATYYFAGSEPFSKTAVCANDPKLSGGECRAGWLRSDIGGSDTLIYLSDAYKPTRYLTITPGVALHRGKSRNDLQSQVTDILAFSPHLSVVWNATHDGKTKLSASFDNYVDTGFLALAGFTSRALFAKDCDWDPEAGAYVKNCRSFGGNTGTSVGRPCGPEGVNPDGTPCTSKLRPPRTWEYTLGAEREIATGIVAGFDFVYRKYVHQWEDVETNALWNQGGTGLRREASFKSGRSEYVFDLQTPDEAQRRYKALTAFLRKEEGVYKLRAFYTWSRDEGTENGSTSYDDGNPAGYATRFLDNPGQTRYYNGPLPTDFRHDLRVQGTYHLRTWASVGVLYQFISGGPYNRYYFDSVYRSFSRFQAKRGYDSKGTLNPDDDVPLRLPDLSMLSVQVRVDLMPLIKQHIHLFADVFNVLALRTTTAVIQTDSPFWGQSIARLPPTRAQVGVQYRF